jgi:hypothetical protein
MVLIIQMIILILQIMIINLSNIHYMAKLKKQLDNIIKFIKKYSIHFAMIIPFTIILLNLTKGSINLLKIPLTLFEVITKFLELVTKLKLINILIVIGVTFFIIKSLNSFAKDIKNKKKKKVKK